MPEPRVFLDKNNLDLMKRIQNKGMNYNNQWTMYEPLKELITPYISYEVFTSKRYTESNIFYLGK